LLEEEKLVTRNRNLFVEVFTIPRNRRASLASFIVMYMQQFCGVNVIAYYSSTIFRVGGFSVRNALLGSWGFGMVNFVFALPAAYTIDTFGRRKLLLTTFPCMAACLLITGFAFYIDPATHQQARVGTIAFGVYLFTAFYSPGEGPVPFTYSAEAFPLYVRDVGMSFATATTWLFNFVVAFTFPRLLTAFKPQGAFGWYAAWNMLGWLLILLFVPETKRLSLEELDQVFNVPTYKQAGYGLRSIPHSIRKYLLLQRVRDMPPLYDRGDYVLSRKPHIGEQAV